MHVILSDSFEVKVSHLQQNLDIFVIKSLGQPCKPSNSQPQPRVLLERAIFGISFFSSPCQGNFLAFLLAYLVRAIVRHPHVRQAGNIVAASKLFFQLFVHLWGVPRYAKAHKSTPS